MGEGDPIGVDTRFLSNEDAARVAAAMSLRDQFAMAALTGIIASEPPETWTSAEFESPRRHRFARMAYKHADAMLAARADGADAT